MKTKNSAHTFQPATNYRVVSMRAGQQADARRLSEALSKGFVARKDPDREGFYSVELDGRTFYIHCHEATKTLYILGAAPKDALEEEVRPRCRTGQKALDRVA